MLARHNRRGLMVMLSFPHAGANTDAQVGVDSLNGIEHHIEAPRRKTSARSSASTPAALDR